MTIDIDNPIEKMNITELLAEKKRQQEGLAEAYRIVEEFRSNLTAIDAAINKIKMPNAGTSRLNRVKNMPSFLSKPAAATPIVKPEPQPPKRKEYYNPSISEHALVRYMERIMDLDVENLRKSILTKDIAAALSMGATRISVNGIEMIAREGKILTVID